MGLPMPDVVFDPANHEYRYDGIAQPSVTGVLKACGFYPQFFNAQKARNFGVEFHAAVAGLEKGAEIQIDPALSPYIDQWEAFTKLMRARGYYPVPELIEKPMYHQQLGFAGTPDVPFRNAKGMYLYVDNKTGVVTPATEIQCACYCELIAIEVGVLPTNIERMALRDCADKFDTHPFDRSRHIYNFNIFRSALNVYLWRKNHNLLGREG
jgi:hypothetical protein